MLPTPQFISTFIEEQFPSFYKEEGPNFIAFVKAYYEWLEETGNSSHKTRNLFSTRDIDQTADQFVENFKAKYLFGIPKEIAGDKRFLQKHILDLYRSKGSQEGLKLLFRLLYNEEIEVYIPSYDILKASDGIWVEKKYIEATYTRANYDFNGKIITGLISRATAFVESFERAAIKNKIINVFYISNIQGEFLVDEKIIYEGLDPSNAPKILGSPVDLNIISTVPDNAVGDVLIPSEGTGSGYGITTVITSTRNAGTSNATIEFKVINGGYGYTANPTVSITTGSNSTGTGATFTGVTLKNTASLSYSTSYINYAPYYPITKTINARTAVANTTDFITIASNPFANGNFILYTTSAGNTAIGGLTNNTSYFVITANSSGFRLASNYSSNSVTFNALTSVSNTLNFITIASNPFSNNDLATYTVPATNTAIGGLVNAASYYVVFANSTGMALANTFGGSNIDITATTSETHTLRLNGRVINLVAGSIETGHNFYKDQVVRFNANSDVNSAIDFISITNNLFANGDHVRYLVAAGNTAISGLTNNVVYYVSSANSSGLKLSTAYGTAQTNITAGLSQYGHTLSAINVASYTLGSYSYGSSLKNANINTIIDNSYNILTTTIGTIDKLTGINPGIGYDGYVNISITDPLVAGFGLTSVNGSILGNNATIWGNVVIGTGLTNSVRIANSGFGYYTNLEDLTLYNSSKANTSQLTRTNINLGGVGKQTGFWRTTKGFISSNKKLQDSYYYQEYSYEIKSSNSLDKYLKILKDVFHPVGNEVFGKAFIYAIDNTQEATISNPVTIFRILGSELARTITFNANTGVSNTSEFITSIGTNELVANDYVKYYTERYNTPIGGLSNNAKYFITTANSTGLQLSTSQGGAAINITSKYTETGHHLVQSVPASGNVVFVLNISRLT